MSDTQQSLEFFAPGANAASAHYVEFGENWARVRRLSEGGGGGGGKRGTVKGFSRGSQLRFVEAAGSICERGRPVFLSLTVPADEADWYRFRYAEKRWKDWLRDEWPGCRGVWKREPTKRGTPHVHFVLWGIGRGRLREFHAAALEAWADLFGSANPWHRVKGVWCERAKSDRAALFYLVKELGKRQWGYGKESGRVWGWVRPEAVKRGNRVRVFFTDRDARTLRAVMAEANRVGMGIAREDFDEFRARAWRIVESGRQWLEDACQGVAPSMCGVVWGEGERARE